MVEWNKKSRRQVPFVEPVGGNHLEIKTSYILLLTSYILHIDRSMTHATRGGDCRQEGGERGYYNLHRNLNQTLLCHTLSTFFVRNLKAEGLTFHIRLQTSNIVRQPSAIV